MLSFSHVESDIGVQSITQGVCNKTTLTS